jgi:hypothetical protein
MQWLAQRRLARPRGACPKGSRRPLAKVTLAAFCCAQLAHSLDWVRFVGCLEWETSAAAIVISTAATASERTSGLVAPSMSGVIAGLLSVRTARPGHEETQLIRDASDYIDEGTIRFFSRGAVRRGVRVLSVSASHSRPVCRPQAGCGITPTPWSIHKGSISRSPLGTADSM